MNGIVDNAWQESRLTAFRSALGESVFGSIAGHESVWANDPYDEESIHAEAREVFSDLLEVASDRERKLERGRILLLLGDAGSGKTHLMGALRREVDRRGAGYFAYAQMSTGMPDLRQYLLRNVANCLQRPGTYGAPSAWMRLSDALVEREGIPEEMREALRNREDYSEVLRDLRAWLLEELKTSDPDKMLHGDYLTALLALQRRDGNASGAAMKYFRGEQLSAEDLEWLCSPKGLSGTGDAHVLFDRLLMAVREFGGARGGAFVLCIDQMEELYERSVPQQQRFPELVAAVCSLVDQHPGLIVVLACLQDYYNAMRDHLLKSHLDRLESHTKPVPLKTERTAEEILALVGKRLDVLYAEAELPRCTECHDPLYPFSRQQLVSLQGSRPRSVLAACYQAWRGSRRTGELPEIKKLDGEKPAVVVVPTIPADEPAWSQKWNDFQSSWDGALPKDSADLAEMLAWSVNALAQQTRTPLRAEAASDLVHLAIDSQPTVAAICNAAAQGGRLKEQLLSLKTTATEAGRKPIAVRSTEFAKSPKAQVMQTVAELVALGGRRVIFPEADWRTVQAWRAFGERHGDESEFTTWAMNDRPLAFVQGLRELVRFEELPVRPAGEESEEPRVPGSNSNGATPLSGNGDSEQEHPRAAEPDLDPSCICLGHTQGLRPAPVTIPLSALCQHIAVLGGTGSGKTTVAMALIEHLVLRGIPAIVVDRKGDLARYADAASLARMEGPLGAMFRERVEVTLYTPGNDDGRSLALSVLPARNKSSTSQELRTQAEDAAQALSAMLGYGESRTHTSRRAALIAAIQVLLELDDSPQSIERLLDLMNSEDPALLQALGYLDHKLLRSLVSDLYSFCRINARVLGAGAEPLDAERLLGLGSHVTPERTRLTVISTKSLGNDEVVQFWVAQLMMELARFASARPSRELQGIVMLDEADLYLPAVGKPASKQPVENALRRFRSGGLGLVLATQSPGDFDYRSRENIGTWLVGRVKETRALEKLRPVFGPEGASALERIGQHATGEFCLVRAEQLSRFQADRNLLQTEQMSDTEIIRAARQLRGS